MHRSQSGKSRSRSPHQVHGSATSAEEVLAHGLLSQSAISPAEAKTQAPTTTTTATPRTPLAPA